jgi:prophage regulatory protein
MTERLLRLREVQQRIPYSRSSIYLKISLGEFPRPVKMGKRAVAWREADVEKWMAERLEARQ